MGELCQRNIGAHNETVACSRVLRMKIVMMKDLEINVAQLGSSTENMLHG